MFLLEIISWIVESLKGTKLLSAYDILLPTLLTLLTRIKRFPGIGNVE